MLACLDFAENFSFVIQESSQSSYFKNKEATVHPVVIYYREGGELKHKSYVIVSDHLQHSTAAVHLFLSKIIQLLKEDLPFKLKKIYYFSDGCAGQYKNKYNAANIWAHFKDFGVEAEWHFYATSHGKSECDGVGAWLSIKLCYFLSE